MMLRPYQQEAYDAVIGHIRKSTNNVLLEAATGAGKSHIIAAIAKYIHEQSGNVVLCIAPSAELVIQNHEKYVATGNKASIYSASAGNKCLRHPVVFGTPITVGNNIEKFKNHISGIIIDEAHGLTPTLKKLVQLLLDRNPRCRVIGLTATPYRMNTGYIFAQYPDGRSNTVETAVEPYFTKLCYSIKSKSLIDEGWLTPVSMMPVTAHYDTSGLELDKTGHYSATTVDKAFIGHGRLTSQIIADVVANSVNRKGVLIFCATVKHAEEALASLPQELSAIVTGETKKRDRDRILHKFKKQQIKYVVNVAVLTTGFDAPHVDVVAVLRATESAGLFQQIIGRGLRLFEGKKDCLVLDYAENVERHCPDGDIFEPQLSVKKSGGNGRIEVTCPSCGGKNDFAMRDNPNGYEMDADGYFVDLLGESVEAENGTKIPAHHGRRCQNWLVSKSTLVQCSHRWEGKECTHCGAENDIAARYCTSCKHEIVDPNEKLRLDFARMKKNPYEVQTDVVVSCKSRPHISTRGNRCLRIDWTTPYRAFATFHTTGNYFWAKLFGTLSDTEVMQILNSDERPQTITYKKEQSKFYTVLGFNNEADVEP